MVGIGEASRQSGVGIETIRYYERIGVVPRPDRSGNGRRVYGPPQIGRLRFLKKCRDLGFALADAKTLLDLSQDTDSPCDAVREMGEQHLRSVRARIAELQKLKAALEELTANCGAGRIEYPMLDRLRRD